MYITAAVVLISAALLFLYGFVKAHNQVYTMIHPKRQVLSFNSKIPFVYKKFNFLSDDGLTLKGIDLKPKVESIGTILACHYLGGTKESIFPFFDSLIQSGFRVLSFDFRNHGESDHDLRISYPFGVDFDAFYHKVQELGVKGPFGVMGFSMGSTPVLYAFSKFPDIKAAVIDSGPLILSRDYFHYVLDKKKVKSPIKRFFFMNIFLYCVGFANMSKRVKKILKSLKGKPVFFIHGEKDDIIPLRNSEMAYKILESEMAVFWKIPRSRHLTNRFVMKEEYETRIVNFFKKNVVQRSRA